MRFIDVKYCHEEGKWGGGTENKRQVHKRGHGLTERAKQQKANREKAICILSLCHTDNNNYYMFLLTNQETPLHLGPCYTWQL